MAIESRTGSFSSLAGHLAALLASCTVNRGWQHVWPVGLPEAKFQIGLIFFAYLCHLDFSGVPGSEACPPAFGAGRASTRCLCWEAAAMRLEQTVCNEGCKLQFHELVLLYAKRELRPLAHAMFELDFDGGCCVSLESKLAINTE